MDYARGLLEELKGFEISDPIQVEKHMIVNDLVKFSKAVEANLNSFEVLNPYWLANAQRLKKVVEFLKDKNAK